MNQFDHLEALAQRLIEGLFKGGPFRRLFQSRLHQPADFTDPLMIAPAANGNHESDTKEVMALTSHHVAGRWALQWESSQVRLGQPVINIGRALDNDIILSDPTVSRYHAQFRWRKGRYHLCPPTPHNGFNQPQVNDTQRMRHAAPWTTVNQQQVVQRPLSAGDVIALGCTELTVVVV